jgi:hypothetical protein
VFLMVLGVALIVPAILFSPIVKLLPIDVKRPWVDGLLINTLRAYKKYNTRSWLRRLAGIFIKPETTLEYLNILLNKQEVRYVGESLVKVDDLQPSHFVQTDHQHHRDRVWSIKDGGQVISEFGDMLAVDNVIHDGNHRLAAYKEAGVEEILLQQWKSV